MDSIPLHGFRLSIKTSIYHSINVVQRGCEGVVVCILQEWAFVLQWPILLFLRAPSSRILSSPLTSPFLAIDPWSGVIFLASGHLFHFAQGLLGILQLQVFTGFPVTLVYTLAFFLWELVPKRGFREYLIREVS